MQYLTAIYSYGQELFYKFVSKNPLDARIQDKSTSISIVVKFE